jgi:hypothetical protein
MTKADRIAAYAQAEIDRFKAGGGDLIDEAECIGKAAFYLAVLRMGFTQHGYEARLELVASVAQAIADQSLRPGNALLVKVSET